MPYRHVTANIITVVQDAQGWTVTYHGRCEQHHPTLDEAYNGALRLCDDLFERGVSAAVVQTA